MGRRIVLLAVVLVLVGCGCGPAAEESARRPAPVVSAARSSPLALLHEWDARRADAWERSDDRALRRLYVPGSAAGAADVALLRRYRARGAVVRDLRMQVLGYTELARTPRLLRLRVTDRVASAEVVGAGIGAGPLPRDSARTRTLELRRLDGTWRMGRVCSGEC